MQKINSPKNKKALTLPSPQEDGGLILRRRKKIKLSARIVTLLLICIGIISIAVIGVGKISDGSIGNMLLSKLSSFLSGTSGGFHTSAPQSGSQESPGSENNTTGFLGEESLPVIVTPSLSDDEDSSSENGTSTSEPNSNGFPIKDMSFIPSSFPYENLTAKKFDLDFLQAMQTAVLPSEGDDPLCLIIHTHASESYLPAGTLFFDPSSGELARSENNAENITSVGDILAKSLNDAGIKAIHVNLHHDKEGSGSAYIQSNATIASYIAKYPSIKYVFDLHRSAEIGDDKSILRDSLTLGEKNLARIRITVSGGFYLSESNINANLALALKINDRLCTLSSSLAHPVRISDAVFCAGISPRSLKIDIGSCASTLEEAKASAAILGEVIASVLKP